TGDTPGRERPQRSGRWVIKRAREGGRSRPGAARAATVFDRLGGTKRRPHSCHDFHATSACAATCRHNDSASCPDESLSCIDRRQPVKGGQFPRTPLSPLLSPSPPLSTLSPRERGAGRNSATLVSRADQSVERSRQPGPATRALEARPALAV